MYRLIFSLQSALITSVGVKVSIGWVAKRWQRSLLYSVVAIFIFLLSSCSKKPDDQGGTGTVFNDPSISAFFPATGAEGTEVRIGGTNFDLDKTKNIVKFNGVVADVMSSSATELRAVVPVGAATGKITVTVGNKTGSSNSNFTVTGQQLTITNVTPDNSEGGTVTINGKGFVNTPAGIHVQFGNLDAAIQPSSTETALVVTLPATLQAGDHSVTVIANNQTVTKANAFHLVGWMVKRFAGTGADGTVDGPATSATFRNPKSVVADKNNNLYVIDGNKIRKIAPDGTVSLVAGKDASGSTDGDALTQATFRSPAALAIDLAGNIYVADEVNHAIRKIGTDGRVTTIAGLMRISGDEEGIGGNARFDSPKGIAVDPQGEYLYVAEWSNHKIKRIHIASQEVITFAGNKSITDNTNGIGTNAGILFPGDLTLDTDGTLYICQSNSRIIRKLNTATAEVTTFKQNLFDSPSNLVIDEDKNVYVLSSGVGEISKYDAGGVQVMARLAGSQIVNDNDGAASAVSFRNPLGLAGVKDAQGNLVLYIADSGNKKIKQIKYE
jgi:sugar lactone lactonase YvrE